MAEEEALDAAATVGDSAVDIEAQIKSAMVARTPYFEKQADSLTFEGVRRLIEKDLGMEKHALDVHKRLIKNCLQECLDGSETAEASNSAKEIQQNIVTSEKSDQVESAESVEPKKETVEPVSENEDKMEDSPVMGLLTTQKVTKAETKVSEGNGNKGDITESTILKAIKKRAAYFRSNAEQVTMAGVRRLLEEDLELEKRALDPFKQFIGKELEKVLEAPEVSKPAKPTKEKTVKKLSKTKASKEVSDGSGADASASEEEEVKPRKKTAAKGRTATDAVKKRKTPPSKEVKTPSKRIKPEKATSNSSEEKEGREHGSGDESQSSGEKHPKKKEVSAPVYGKRVERLKSIIKACGMGVPPSIYKKVKQGPEDKREARLIKELEEILSKEGLSANPSEKEIKDVKRKKERARELEGIDTSNIVSSSRRRSTSSYVPPPKPKIAVESEGEESEESEEEDDEEDDENNDDDNNDGNDESQGEDASEGEEESD